MSPAPLAHVVDGDGPTVVLVHGLPGSVRDFRHLVPHLDGVRAVRVDLPGFGDTPRGRHTVWPPELRARALLELMDHLDVERAMLVGHSMGGPVVVAAADLAPERIAAVGLVASPGPTPHGSYERLRVRTVGRLLRIPGSDALLRPILRRAFVAAGFSRKLPPSALTSTMRDAASVDFGVHAARLGRLSVPTLVAWANDDALVEPEQAEAIAGLVPDGPRLHWAEGGHNVQKTRAAVLGPAIVALARETLAAPPR